MTQSQKSTLNYCNLYHFTTYGIGLSGLCNNIRSLYKILYYVLSEAEAPKLLYFLLEPKYNFLLSKCEFRN